MANRGTSGLKADLHTGVNRIVGRFVHRVAKAPGSPPGTLTHGGPQKVEAVRIRLITYDGSGVELRTVDRVEDCFPLAEAPTVTWINIDGLHEPQVIADIGARLGLHRLLMEDVLSLNQRAKVEEYDPTVFLVVKMLSMEKDAETVSAEQVSLVTGDRYVVSFQERFGDVFEPVRQRLREGTGKLRHKGADYLLYALVDAVVDSYFRVLEEVGNRTEGLDELALEDPSMEVMHRIHRLKRETLVLRRAVWPLREVLGSLYRGELSLIQEETQVYFRDVYDHGVQVIDTVETLREVLSGTMDLYLSGVSNRMNEVMKVLTIIATIFIPLSFFAGLYGMNFENMPELALPWAYPALLLGMATIASGMLWYFRRKGWL